MKFAFFAFLAHSVVAVAVADIPVVPKSDSPDGKFHAVMDIDRDPSIVPEWKGDSFPRIEITEKATGRVLASVEYFGAVGDDARPLREHVKISWRADSRALAVTIDDRFYSATKVLARGKDLKFVDVPLPSYKAMTGFPLPDVKELRPRGRETVKGWDERGRLIYRIFYSPLPSYKGKDPLRHQVLLEVSPSGVKRVSKLDAKDARAEKAGAHQSTDTPESESGEKEKPKPESKRGSS